MGASVELNSNYEEAKRRFNSLSHKLNKNREIYDKYKQIIWDELKCQIVGKCINEDRDSGYYMPHRAVIRDEKDTTRVRIVYDCSSKTNENIKSLNESLEFGVNLYANLLDIILKFREKQVAFC
ncbi:reverse transcriptase domain-containing protein [Nephila pilipes]|uniref:Reverse transcriptase domain-containing protein n=1 Tax=Nephila pilipes TaxID=299642 RepID=A0A8X6TMK2_NEPPI|nr:reverse transcriptase domain-containing protein [Nephila pilipes]